MNKVSAITTPKIVVTDPYSGAVVGEVEETLPAQVDELIARAQVGFKLAAKLPRHERARILLAAAASLKEQSERFAQLIVSEAGKTLVQARKEVTRAVNTMALSGEEAKRNQGETVPFDAFEGSENRTGYFDRRPLGVIAAITPFNDPLNLVAHKLGPAIAGGNSVLLKPSELTPLCALALVDLLVDAGLPESCITVAVGDAVLGAAIVSDRAVRMVSFTGGMVAGEAITRIAGLKKLTMDLGGNAPVIVMNDCDLEQAIDGCVSGAFWAAGQNCIGTQRILLQKDIASEFTAEFVAKTSSLVSGDPREDTTDMGPMISEAAAIRAEELVREALASGAKLLCGGTRQGSVMLPTVMSGVPEDCCLWREEAFAPIVTLSVFDSIDEAIALANSCEYSLHAGLFTRDLNTALRLSDEIEAAGVMVNDSSDYRFDAMPFGGFKYGSMGREGVRFALEDMTQPKVTCFLR